MSVQRPTDRQPSHPGVGVALVLAVVLWAAPARAASIDNLLAEAGSAISNRAFENALDLANQAVGAAPTDARAYIIRSRVHYRLRDYTASITDVDTALSIAPDTPASFTLRGMSEYQLGQFQAAIADFSRTIATAQESTTAYRWRGFTYFVLGKNENAVVDLTAALHGETRDPEPYRIRGLALARLGRIDAAIADYKQALRLHGDPAKLEYLLGNAYAAQGAMAEADRAYGRIGACWGTRCPPPPPAGETDGE